MSIPSGANRIAIAIAVIALVDHVQSVKAQPFQGYRGGSAYSGDLSPPGCEPNACYPYEDCYGCKGCYPDDYSADTGRRWGAWARVEYLMWWTEGQDLPPLVTTSPIGTPREDAGVLGHPTTEILFGDETVGDELRNGLRATIGMWLDPCEICGIEASWFTLEDIVTGSAFESDAAGSPIIARPFFDPSTDEQASTFTAFPDIVAGRISSTFDSDVESINALLRLNLAPQCRGRTDLLVGYRYFRLDESLSISDQSISIDTGGFIPLGTTFDLFDSFETESEFQGCDVGILKALYHNNLTLEGRAKVALGNMYNRVNVEGSTVVTIPLVDPIQAPGGLLAQPTNIGSQSDNEFAAIPEVAVNLRWQANRHLAASFGYTFMYVDDVLRVSDQIDTEINSTQIGGGTLFGEARPESRFVTSDFWLQGLNFGIEANW